MKPQAPSFYSSYAEFERDEIRPMQKAGFSLDDLEAEATYRPAPEDVQEGSEPEELDFG